MSQQARTPRIAVLGCGAWGVNHVRVWRELGLLKVVCDPSSSRLDSIQDHPDIEKIGDPEEVLNRDDIDAVVLATPAGTHAELALRFLKSGKDVLVEKPMALSVADGEEVIRVARETQQIVAVGHVLEYHPAITTLRDLIDAGELGQLRYAYSNRLNFGRIRTEENALWSFAPHDIAVMVRLFGDLPEEVACQGGNYFHRDVADVTLTTLKFAGETRGHIFVSWLHPFKEHRLVVVGERQMAVFDDTADWPEKLTLYPHEVDWVGGQIPVARKAEGVAVPLKVKEPLLIECEQFAHSVIHRTPPLVDGDSGLRVLTVLDAAEKSLVTSGKPQTITTAASYYAHPSATIDAGARIGAATKIWHSAHVMEDAEIGVGCILGQNVFVGRGVQIGRGVKIQNNVSVFEGVTLEDHVFCGPSVVFTNVVDPRSDLERKDEFRETLVKEGASLGANSTILPGVTIGSRALVGAGAVVTHDVPPNALVVGSPARINGWVCNCGRRLTFEDEVASCSGCGARYRQVGPERIDRVDDR